MVMLCFLSQREMVFGSHHLFSSSLYNLAISTVLSFSFTYFWVSQSLSWYKVFVLKLLPTASSTSGCRKLND